MMTRLQHAVADAHEVLALLRQMRQTMQERIEGQDAQGEWLAVSYLAREAAELDRIIEIVYDLAAYLESLEP